MVPQWWRGTLLVCRARAGAAARGLALSRHEQKHLRSALRRGPDLLYGFLGFSPGPRGFKGPPAKSDQSPK
ncbi:hypothetical protein EVAR_31832_1 [Eumeta japonica]|uniref:Uncharacterized protein n=1 Tax=Eumeta variegata TaxID=151549 RepID=A0A4C1WI78_EUMVA|nr:hypothetical protein EVAR_31832_1 [Eumeta japonica]